MGLRELGHAGTARGLWGRGGTGGGADLGNWGDPGWREGACGWDLRGASAAGAAPRAGLGLPPLGWLRAGVRCGRLSTLPAERLDTE